MAANLKKPKLPKKQTTGARPARTSSLVDKRNNAQNTRTRSQIAKLTDKATARRSELVAKDNDELDHLVERQQQYWQEAPDREAILGVDGELTQLATELSLEKLRNIMQDREGLTPSNFNAGVQKSSPPGSAVDWTRVGHAAWLHWSGATTTTWMLGAFTQEYFKKPRPRPKRRSRDDDDSGDDPMQNSHGLRMTEDPLFAHDKFDAELKKRATEIQKILHQRGAPINFFELVINPRSYSQTVENVFFLSHTQKEGVATISMDGEVPYVAIKDEGDDEISSVSQWVYSMNEDDYKAARRVFGLEGKAPVIKHRVYAIDTDDGTLGGTKRKGSTSDKGPSRKNARSG